MFGRASPQAVQAKAAQKSYKKCPNSWKLLKRVFSGPWQNLILRELLRSP